jgi:hypothetical protein
MALTPPRGCVGGYRNCIMRVVVDTSRQRSMIESIDSSGGTFRSTVKWKNLQDHPNSVE